MRKRSKYRPKAVLVNPVAYAIESVSTVTSHRNFLLDLKIKNSQAMYALTHGSATKADMDLLIAMSNMAEALHQLGHGAEYQDVCVGGRAALISIAYRAKEHGRFVPTGPEIQALQLLMELHDAQMDVITVKDVEKAIAVVEDKLTRDKDTVRLPVSAAAA